MPIFGGSNDDYYKGNISGHAGVSSVAGAMVAGGTYIAGSGAAVCLSGVGCVAGAPAVAGGATLVGVGGYLANNAISNIQSAQNNYSFSKSSKSSFTLSSNNLQHIEKHIASDFSKQVPYLSDKALADKLKKNTFFKVKSKIVCKFPRLELVT